MQNGYHTRNSVECQQRLGKYYPESFHLALDNYNTASFDSSSLIHVCIKRMCVNYVLRMCYISNNKLDYD